MGTDGDPATVSDSLAGDIVVVGSGAALETVPDRATANDHPRVVETGDPDSLGDAVSGTGVIVVAMDAALTADSLVSAADNADGFVVAVFDGDDDERIDPSLLDTAREVVDVTLLACRQRPADEAGSPPERPGKTDASGQFQSAVVGGAFDFARMIHRPGHINLDLADARTVLTDGSLAALASGTASLETDGSSEAVRRAFTQLPPSIDMTPGSDVLVSLVGGPKMSIDDAIAAVQAVRQAAGDTETLIWGVATDDALADRVTVGVVVDDIAYRPPLSAGDPCRRCGAALSVYTLGERTTIACQGCGFADLSTSLGERLGYDPGS